MSWTWMDHYYFANSIWIDLNLLCILPFVGSCINRFRQPSIKIPLWTDHITRFFLSIQAIFYVYDTIVKYAVDGGDTICQKSLFIHHVASQFVILPVIFNSYVPWWINPVGFLHGLLVYFPNLEALNYVYALFVIYFHYKIHQPPYRDMRFYGACRVAINGVWAFTIFLMIGDCSNYLQIGPD